jgi:hypothetical protein
MMISDSYGRECTGFSQGGDRWKKGVGAGAG